MTASDSEMQGTLLDLEGQEFNVNWVDPKQPLFVPNNSLHFKAHKLQLLLSRLDKQAANNPAQFNSKNYTETLDALVRCIDKINSGAVTDDDDSDRSSDLADDGNPTTADALGDRVVAGLGTGISADNPFAGQGTDTVRALAVPAGVS